MFYSSTRGVLCKGKLSQLQGVEMLKIFNKCVGLSYAISFHCWFGLGQRWNFHARTTVRITSNTWIILLWKNFKAWIFSFIFMWLIKFRSQVCKYVWTSRIFSLCSKALITEATSGPHQKVSAQIYLAQLGDRRISNHLFEHMNTMHEKQFKNFLLLRI